MSLFTFYLNNGNKHTIISDSLENAVNSFIHLHGIKLLNGVQLEKIAKNNNTLPTDIIKKITSELFQQNIELNLELAIELVTGL